MPEWTTPLLEFFERGGPMLYVLLLLAILLWTLIVERVWFYYFSFPRRANAWRTEWRSRKDHSSLRAHRIREAMISEARIDLESGVTVIATLVAICPLLGLLGTVTGMIQVFDVMALNGSSDAKAMAAGVSRATIPTMAGMVLALPGLFYVTRCRHFSRRLSQQLADSMRFG
ncbi:MAG: MotA/TolQ/ExbB proton channel family protein [Oceanococcus sp.]